eukprot:CAMPEP_0172306774 /NCGR_PEP_ID=MMETSP1058-20130122/7776_1 /TAXON_ID=83371 /ORGANISM="Detonula confervacea, Strain CCMP 353" /LENGTH=455 /DNA_ID=CAMNT_0013018761 /DNA_START=464 /DNA_END=1831 /DNA_ORIENTATION=+
MAMASSTKELSKRKTWTNMSHRRASLSRLDSLSSIPSQGEDEDGSIFEKTLQALLNPSRLAALDAADVAPVPYNTYFFFSHFFHFRGRNLRMILAPLLSLFLWGLGWQLLFVYGLKDDVNDVQEYLASLDYLITPLLTPLSFMLTYRLGRAAIRYWDARQAVGKMVEICRSNIATVSVWFNSPIRLRKRHRQKQQPQSHVTDNGKDQAKQSESAENCRHDAEDAEALELLCEYARWLAVFPIAVKHFLRPETRPGWEKEDRYKKRRYEIGPLLSDEDARNVIMEYDDEDGKPTSNSVSGTRVRDPPLVVLNRLHELAYDIAHYAFTDNGPASFLPTSQGRAIFYQQTGDQINILFGAYGAMERIKGTPLPFVYVIHLRTFLMIYLFLWNMSSVATYGWTGLPFLFLLNWALLGIEAAAVECERPFDYNPNHLTLGKVCVVVARNIGQALKEVVVR